MVLLWHSHHSSPYFLGYRKIRNILRSNGVCANRKSVMEIIRELHPEKVALQGKKRLLRRVYSVPGPDFFWHQDVFDKLKSFGFALHGCIDDYSGKIIWLEVASTNKDPSVVEGYFLKAVKSIGGLPVRIRSDETENSLIEAVQIAIRSQHDDEYAGLESYCVDTSPANQRIESLWSQLTKDRPLWWRQFFAQLFLSWIYWCWRSSIEIMY